MSAPRLTIAICTADRPEGLARLLEDLARAEPGTWSREVLVVDNGAAPVTADARVVTSARRDIARARNTALAEARGELVLWLDDDQRVGPTFFGDLERAWAHRPSWSLGLRLAVRPVFEGARGHYPYTVGHEGEPARRATFGTNGLLVARAAWSGLSFDERFGTRGGEDTELFLRAADQLRVSCTRMVWVDEVVPARRNTRGYRVRHDFRVGFTDTRIDLVHGSRARVVCEAAAAMVFTSLCRPCAWPRQAGKLWALMGGDYQHYRGPS